MFHPFHLVKDFLVPQDCLWITSRTCLLFQYAFRQLFSENLFTRRSKRSLSTWYGPPVIPDRDVKAYVDLVLSDPKSHLSNLLWHRRLMFAVSTVQCRGLRLFNAYSVESFNSRVGSHLQLRPSQWSSSSRFYWSWAVGWCLMVREVYDTCLHPLSEKTLIEWLLSCILDAHSASVQS